MIQRRQTLFLLLTSILAITCLFFPLSGIISADGVEYRLGLNGLSDVAGASTSIPVFPFIVIQVPLVAIPVISVIAIMMYRNLRLQGIMALLLIAIEIITVSLLIYFNIKVLNRLEGSLHLFFSSFSLLIMIILSTLAYRGINKDRELLRSYDRLR